MTSQIVTGSTFFIAELAAIRAALKGVLPRVTCPKCDGTKHVFANDCEPCNGAGTIDPVDGAETTLGLVETTLELVERVKEMIRKYHNEDRELLMRANDRAADAQKARDRIAGEVREQAAKVAEGYGYPPPDDYQPQVRIAAAIRAMPLPDAPTQEKGT